MERVVRDEDVDVAERDLVVITGMSGAGRSEAIHTFEDLGYFCIDNLPPAFITRLVELSDLPDSRIRRAAVVCDVRGRSFFMELAAALDGLDQSGTPHRVLYLEADDKTLVKRFKETRRRHPLAEAGSIAEGIKAERETLCSIRERADHIIDTSDLMPQELRAVIRQSFAPQGSHDALMVTVSSFGFKYGVPTDSDLVMDVRFLTNPFYVARLRSKTGLDRPVKTFVLDRPETKAFLEKWLDLLDLLLPDYVTEGKTHLHIALGCTGGMHRSVVLAEYTADHLRSCGYAVNVGHRDIGRDKGAR
ncbi:MAG: RNase adapter RapZ [Coriobacteriia bacterium]|nr:RNase adapter RapZ [Coriobacteriia bacterium]